MGGYLEGTTEVLGRGRGEGGPSATETVQIIQGYNSRQEQQDNVCIIMACISLRLRTRG